MLTVCLWHEWKILKIQSSTFTKNSFLRVLLQKGNFKNNAWIDKFLNRELKWFQKTRINFEGLHLLSSFPQEYSDYSTCLGFTGFGYKEPMPSPRCQVSTGSCRFPQPWWPLRPHEVNIAWKDLGPILGSSEIRKDSAFPLFLYFVIFLLPPGGSR